MQYIKQLQVAHLTTGDDTLVRNQMLIAADAVRNISSYLDALDVAHEIAVCGGAVNDWTAGKPARDVDIVLCLSESFAEFSTVWSEKFKEHTGFAPMTSEHYKDSRSYFSKVVDGVELQLLVSYEYTLESRMADFPCSKSMVCAVPTESDYIWSMHALWLWSVCEAATVLIVGGNRVNDKYVAKMEAKYPECGKAVCLDILHYNWTLFAKGQEYMQTGNAENLSSRQGF